MKKSRNINRMGFVDIEMRDETNMPIFKSRGKNLGNGIKEFENFLNRKLGVKGFSAFEFKGYPSKKKQKEEDEDCF